LSYEKLAGGPSALAFGILGFCGDSLSLGGEIQIDSCLDMNPLFENI
jgi:hypothetical protein